MALIDWDNNNWREKENGDFVFDLANITAKTFDITAKKWALVIANAKNNPKDRSGGVEKNQLRNFYDKVLELEEKALNSTEEEFQKKVLPFVKMLNSKVAYAKNKQTSPVNMAFVHFMTEAIGQVKSIETFKNFKYLFEAVVGFYQKGIFLKESEQNNNNHNNRNQGGRR